MTKMPLFETFYGLPQVYPQFFSSQMVPLRILMSNLGDRKCTQNIPQLMHHLRTFCLEPHGHQVTWLLVTKQICIRLSMYIGKCELKRNSVFWALETLCLLSSHFSMSTPTSQIFEYYPSLFTLESIYYGGTNITHP